MNYAVWLIGLSLLFILVERVWPRSPQKLLRRGIVSDVAYLVFNSEYLGVLIGALSIHAVAWLDRTMDLLRLREVFYLGVMSGHSFAVQFVVLLLVFDFAQWGIHNLLHRVPILWRFHRVHHSIEEMDWIGNWRFHGVEVIVYRALLYPCAAFFGFGVEAMFTYGVFNTLIGHFAHANLRARIGWLRYLINSPEMHIWHHTHPDSGPMNRNFGIALSVWDWVFGTAYLPAAAIPARLGFTGIEAFPKNIVTQTLAPLLWDGRGKQ